MCSCFKIVSDSVNTLIQKDSDFIESQLIFDFNLQKLAWKLNLANYKSIVFLPPSKRIGFEVGYLTSINVNESDKDNEQGNCLSFSRDLSSK